MVAGKKNESLGLIDFQPYTVDKLNKLAFMCATGSGKTLIMHLNILQFLHYFKRAKRLNSKLSINKIIVLAPNEGMSKQHLEELACPLFRQPCSKRIAASLPVVTT